MYLRNILNGWYFKKKPVLWHLMRHYYLLRSLSYGLEEELYMYLDTAPTKPNETLLST